MRRKRHVPIFVRNCDYCGTELKTNEPNSDSYVITAEHKIFCKIHHVGEEPIKDCLEDYIRSKKNVRNETKKINEIQHQEKKEISKKEKEKVLKKLDDYLFELKQKQRRQRAAKFQTETYSESKSTI